MPVKLDDTALAGQLWTLLATTGDARRQAAAELVAWLAGRDVLTLWGNNLANLYSRPGDREEITQVVTETLLRFLNRLDDTTLKASYRPSALLYYTAKTGVMSWVDGPAVTLASGMSGYARRHRRAMHVAARLRSTWGREPTVQEVVDQANAEAAATRANPVKQGALLTVDDVTGILMRPLHADQAARIPDRSVLDDTAVSAWTGADADGHAVLQPHQRDRLTDDTADTCGQDIGDAAATLRWLCRRVARLHPEHEQAFTAVLEAWATLVLDGDTPTRRSVSRACRLPEATVTDMLGLLDDALAVLRGQHPDLAGAADAAAPAPSHRPDGANQ